MPLQKSTMDWDKILNDICEDSVVSGSGGNAYMSIEDARCTLESEQDIALPVEATCPPSPDMERKPRETSK